MGFITIVGAFGIDEYAVVGRLHRLWSWANRHLTNGDAAHVTEVWVDRYVGAPGFAAAMQATGWLEASVGGVTFPSFEQREPARGQVARTYGRSDASGSCGM